MVTKPRFDRLNPFVGVAYRARVGRNGNGFKWRRNAQDRCHGANFMSLQSALAL